MVHYGDIIKIIESLGVFAEDNADGTLLLENVIEDSIQFISFIIEIEQIFSVEIPDEYLIPERMNTINDVCSLVENLLSDI